MSVEISVIVPAFNPPENALARCIESLLTQDYAGRFELILVDDGSDECLLPDILPTLESHQYLCDVTVIKKVNGGPGSARNEGLSIARGSIVAFIDSDCRATQDWLSEISRYFQRYPSVSGLGGAIDSSTPKTANQRMCSMNGALTPMVSKDGSLVTAITANAAFRKEAICSELGFNRAFQYAYEHGIAARGFEDAELSQRMAGAGHTIRFAPNVKVSHYHRKTFSERLSQWHAYGVGAGIYLRSMQAQGLNHNLDPYPPPKRLTPLSIVLHSIVQASGAAQSFKRFRRGGASIIEALVFSILTEAQRPAFWFGLATCERALATVPADLGGICRRQAYKCSGEIIFKNLVSAV